MFLASLSPSAVMIELRLVFGGFERIKQARPVRESGGFRRRSVFLRTLTSVRALWWNDPKDIPTWSFSNLPISPLWVQSVAWLSKLWMFWQMPFQTANNEAAMSLNKEHTHESGRWARRGVFTGELSAGWAPTRHFYCGSYAGNLLKLFCQFTLFSIHTIGIAWNAILLKVSNEPFI